MMEGKRVILNYHRDLCVYVQDDNFLTDDDILLINQENEVAIVCINVSTLFAKVLIQVNEAAIVYKNVSTLFAKVLIQVNEVETVYKNVSSVPNKIQKLFIIAILKPFLSVKSLV